ncbi:MAG: phosphate ABC transporter permease subunit PstC [Phycisphaerales bacterium]
MTSVSPPVPARVRPAGRAPLRTSVPLSAVVRERAIGSLLFLAAAASVLITAGIVFILISESIPFFQHASIVEFLTGTQWTPLFAEPRYGILPLVCGTVITTLVALMVAMPMGTVIAIWLSEYAPVRLREGLKPLLELLAAVPTVVYGYFAIQLVTPLLQKVIPGLPQFNMLSAGLVMGIMIIPYVSSLSEDAMRAVPMILREGSFAMGANRLTTSLRVVFPAALSGIGAAYILAISRAIGETMIVAIAAGQVPNLTIDPREPAFTITAYIVQVSMGDLPHGSIGYQSIFAAGITLFCMTLVFNIAGYILRKRYRQVY